MMNHTACVAVLGCKRRGRFCDASVSQRKKPKKLKMLSSSVQRWRCCLRRRPHSRHDWDVTGF